MPAAAAWLAAVVAASACAAHDADKPMTVQVKADDPRITWIGRYVKPGDGTVVADWQSVEARFMISGAETLQVQMQEGNGAGQRWAVYIRSASQTGNTTFRTSSFWSTPGQSTYTVLGGWVMSPAEIRLQRTLEPAASGAPWSGPTIINGFSLDYGTFSAAPRSNRTMEILGDSITAGMGVLGNAASKCGGSGFLTDYSFTYGQALCAALDGACSSLAWSGISLTDPRTGPALNCTGRPGGQCTLPDLYPWALASTPGSHPWAFGQTGWTPAAVHINLGTNDARLNNFTNTTFAALYEQTYVAFVRNISALDGDEAAKSIRYFLAVGPMSTAYSASLYSVAASLTGLGYSATVLDYTLPDYGPATVGCEYHPSIHLHQEMADKNYPVIKQVMGW